MALKPLTALLAAVLFALSMGGCKEVNARRKIQEGNKAYYKGDYEKAVVYFEEGLAEAPNLEIGWFNLGLARIALFSPGLKTKENLAQADAAIKAFEEYLKIVPDDTQARDYLLSTYIDSGRYEGAIAYFEKQLEKNPKDLGAIAQLAQINTQAGKFDEAEKWHRKKAELETTVEEKANALYSIGVMQWRRLHQKGDVVGLDRQKIADKGIEALLVADSIRKNHGPTLSYVNLLYRERGSSHDASYARVIEVANAQVHQKRAIELNKAAQAAQAGTPGQPTQPPKKK